MTIIAACGNDSDAGLSGLRDGTRSQEQEEVLVIPPNGQEPGLSVLTTLRSHPPEMDENYGTGTGEVDISK